MAIPLKVAISIYLESLVTSLLMVTHDESLLSRFDKVLSLESGKII